MNRVLTDAARVGSATARAILYATREEAAYQYPGSDWRTAFVGGDHRFAPGGVLDLYARSMFFFCCTGITPAMAIKRVGVGSQYAVASRNDRKMELDGGKSYRMHLPPGIPARDFWSLTVYDPQTRSYLQTDQPFPSIGSQGAGLVVNPDTSVDIWLGPKPPPGKEANWVQTWPGKGWFAMLRLYGPLESWFDRSWRPGEIEEVL